MKLNFSLSFPIEAEDLTKAIKKGKNIKLNLSDMTIEIAPSHDITHALRGCVDPNPSQSRIIGTQSEQASHFPFTFVRSHAGRTTQNVIANHCTN